MNVALIFAGGTGQRMHSGTIPKQFLQLHGKPILIYTIEQFESHEKIDGIVVVCLETWIERLLKMLDSFGIRKVKAIVPGGASGQESIFNGIKAAREWYSDDDILLVHDGVRPLIDEVTITNAIACAEMNGNAITVTSAIETVTIDNEGDQIGTIVERSRCKMARAPQCFALGEIYAAHMKARQDQIDTFIDSASMMKYYGHPLFCVEGPAANIKITTPSDFYIFRALTDAKEDSQVFGL